MLALALGLASLLLEPQAPSAALAADPAFAADALAVGGPGSPFQLKVHRLAATPASLTVWWEVTGPGAARAAPTCRIQIYAPGTAAWLDPDATETTAASGDRLLGKSSVAADFLNGDSSRVRLHALQGRTLDWEITVPAALLDQDPAARRVAVDHAVEWQGHRVTVEAVDLAASYTALRFTLSPADAAVFNPLPTVLALGPGAIPHALDYRGTWPRPDAASGGRTLLLSPTGAADAELHSFFALTPAALRDLSVDHRLDGSDPDVRVRSENGAAVVSVAVPAGWYSALQPTFADDAGQPFPPAQMRAVPLPDGRHGLELTAPAGKDPAHLRLAFGPDTSVHVRLPPGPAPARLP